MSCFSLVSDGSETHCEFWLEYHQVVHRSLANGSEMNPRSDGPVESQDTAIGEPTFKGKGVALLRPDLVSCLSGTSLTVRRIQQRRTINAKRVQYR